jgi:striatin 1/3/4
LQEISYLTSPGALNPLPTRIPLSLSGPPSVEGGEGQSNGAPEERTAALGLRPKKVLPEEPIPSIFDKDKRKDLEMKSVAVQAPGEAEEAPATDEQQRQGVSRQSSGGQPAAASDQSSSSPMVNGDHAAVPSVDDQQSQLLTAVYKPESKSAWKEALRDANEKAQQAQQQVENGVPPPSGALTAAPCSMHQHMFPY